MGKSFDDLLRRPSSSRGSPWMRGAPQRGLARAMVRTSFATSQATGGRPVRPRRDFQFQKARKPCRCQRMTSAAERHGALRATAPTAARATSRRGDRVVRTEVASRGGGAGRVAVVAPGSQERGRCGPRAQRAERPASEYEGHLPSSLASLSATVQRSD